LPLGFIVPRGQGPQGHAQLEYVRFHADIHGDPLIAGDLFRHLGRLPAYRASTAVDVNNLGIAGVIDDDIGERKVSLDISRLMDLTETLDNLLRPALSQIPWNIALMVIQQVDEGPLLGIPDEQALHHTGLVIDDDASELDHALGALEVMEGVELVQELIHGVGTGDLLLDVDLVLVADLVDEARQMSLEVQLIFRNAGHLRVQVADAGDLRIGDDLVDILGHVHMESTVDRLQFEVGDGGIELDLREGFTDGLIDAGALITLVVKLLQILLQRIGRGSAIITGDGDPPPTIGGLGVGDEKLLSLRLVTKLHAEIENPSPFQLHIE
jgi:hypothetical protein